MVVQVEFQSLIGSANYVYSGAAPSSKSPVRTLLHASMMYTEAIHIYTGVLQFCKSRVFDRF